MRFMQKQNDPVNSVNWKREVGDFRSASFSASYDNFNYSATRVFVKYSFSCELSHFQAQETFTFPVILKIKGKVLKVSIMFHEKTSVFSKNKATRIINKLFRFPFHHFHLRSCLLIVLEQNTSYHKYCSLCKKPESQTLRQSYLEKCKFKANLSTYFHAYAPITQDKSNCYAHKSTVD